MLNGSIFSVISATVSFMKAGNLFFFTLWKLFITFAAPGVFGVDIGFWVTLGGSSVDFVSYLLLMFGGRVSIVSSCWRTENLFFNGISVEFSEFLVGNMTGCVMAQTGWLVLCCANTVVGELGLKGRLGLPKIISCIQICFDISSKARQRDRTG